MHIGGKRPPKETRYQRKVEKQISYQKVSKANADRDAAKKCKGFARLKVQRACGSEKQNASV